MEYPSFPYDWGTGTVLDHPAITEHMCAEEGSRDWPAIEFVWMTLDHATLADGEYRVLAYFTKYPDPTAAVMPTKYEHSSEVRVNDVIWPLMGASAPVDTKVVVEHGSRTPSSAEQVVEEHEKSEKAAMECDEWDKPLVTPRRNAQVANTKAVIAMCRRPLPLGSLVRCADTS